MAKWRQCDDTWSVVYQSGVNFQNILEISIAKVQKLSDNGPILTLASSARWSGTFSNLSGRPGRDPVAAPLLRKLTSNFWVEKNTILETSLWNWLKICMFLGLSKLINIPYWRFAQFFLKVGFFGHFVTSISPIFHFLTVFGPKVQLRPHN